MAEGLPREDIYEQVRKADFNKTEPETLSQLVNSAIRIGDEMKAVSYTHLTLPTNREV